MNNPKGLRYTKEHEWVKMEGEKAYIGITDYAQHSLGDIVFVELPKLDKKLTIGDVLGVVESVKTVADVYSPVTGTVTEINEELSNSPESINSNPYDSWIAVVELDNSTEVNGLMDDEEYNRFCLEEGK